MPYFETVLRSSVRLVLASLERGNRQHVDTLDIGMPPRSKDLQRDVPLCAIEAVTSRAWQRSIWLHRSTASAAKKI